MRHDRTGARRAVDRRMLLALMNIDTAKAILGLKEAVKEAVKERSRARQHDVI
jgi:hypothetical protein